MLIFLTTALLTTVACYTERTVPSNNSVFSFTNDFQYAWLIGPTDKLQDNYKEISCCFVLNYQSDVTPFAHRTESFHTLISTLVKNDEFSVTFMGNNPLRIHLGKDKRGKDLKICMVYSSVTGKLEVYLDGESKGSVIVSTSLWKNEKKRHRVSLFQNTVLTHKNNVGSIYGLQMYNYLLSMSKVAKYTACPSSLPGNMLDWSKSTWKLFRNAKVAKANFHCSNKKEKETAAMEKETMEDDTGDARIWDFGIVDAGGNRTGATVPSTIDLDLHLKIRSNDAGTGDTRRNRARPVIVLTIDPDWDSKIGASDGGASGTRRDEGGAKEAGAKHEEVDDAGADDEEVYDAGPSDTGTDDATAGKPATVGIPP